MSKMSKIEDITPQSSIDENTVEKELAPDSSEEVSQLSVGKSAAMMSVLIVFSRITGFFRTWAQAFALGISMVASCYTVANNLPNQLYELVMGGMLVTAFLPVYIGVKKKMGRKGASAYASNLISVVLVLMGACTILGIIFAYPLVMTQSFGAAKEFDHNLATYFFRFFAIEILLYALSSVLSGILNANRDYFWSTAAPIFNNLICIFSFIGFALFQSFNSQLAFLILAIGNPLGVLAQVVMQIPSLKKEGLSFRFHLNWKDPALKETVSLGVPALICTIGIFIAVSVQSSCALQVRASGAAISYYARLWYTLPYSVIVVPISTALFTELSNSYAENNPLRFKHQISTGTLQILYFLIPLSGLLIVFSPQLIGIMNSGNFTTEEIHQTASFLAVLATALPLYGLSIFLQKVFSSYRKLSFYAGVSTVACIVEILFCIFFTQIWGLNVVAFSNTLNFLVLAAVSYFVLRKNLGQLGFKKICTSIGKMLVLSIAICFIAFLVKNWFDTFFFLNKISAVSSIFTLLFVGVPALFIIFALAIWWRIPGGEMIYEFLEKRKAKNR